MDVVVGYIEFYVCEEMLRMLEGILIILLKVIIYKNIVFKEFDLDEVLKWKLEFILVDEFVYMNVLGVCNKKCF